MNPQLIFVLGVLSVCVAMFVVNRPRMDVVALLALTALPLAGVVTVPEALAGFSDANVVLIALLFVVGEGLVQTGIANRIGDFLLRRAGDSEIRLIALLMVSVAVLGSLMSSIGVVAFFIPVVLDIAERQQLPPGRLMMPLSMAALISGMLTLIGTAPNLVANSALQGAGFAGFTFFSFTPFGAVILAAGVGYMLMSRRRLTRVDDGERRPSRRRSLIDFVRDYDLAAREHRLRVDATSPLVGRTLQQLAADERPARIVAIERTTGSRHELLEPRGDSDVRAGDVLLVDFADPIDDALVRELASLKLERLPLRDRYFTDQSRELGMAEVLLPPDSELVGRTVIEANFRRRYGLHAIGLRRTQTALEGGVAGERLRAGDVLLLFGRWKDVRTLQTHARDFLVLHLPAEIDQAMPATSRAPYALATLLAMVTLMVTGWVPNVLAALLACLFMVLGGCLSLDSAYKSIQWPSLILIAGMMPFSVALERTGGVDLAVAGLVRIVGDAEPRVLLTALFILTAIVTQFISNTATAVLMAPIALAAAREMQVSPEPLVMTVALAASAAFMTPVSSPVNTLVMVPGGYRFGDFVRLGVPFTVVVLVITVVLVPWVLPLRPMSHGRSTNHLQYNAPSVVDDVQPSTGPFEALDPARSLAMRRADMLARLDQHPQPWDIVVIGGGATGVGIAVDAASRGYDVLLLEQHDFGKGTSSRSTKLVHGGVRYLEQGNLALVMEALKERGLLRQNAPHLVSNLAFVVPNYDWWEAPFYGLGLKIYNMLAGKYGFGTSEILTREETLARLPTIKTEGLRGGVVYYDGQFDDARLLINLAETAADQGATLVNYVRVVALSTGADGFLDGVVAVDQESGQEWTIAARVVVNATGPFSDAVRRLADPEAETLIAPSQGIHLVFHHSFLAADSAIMVPHTSDGRVMFAIPWHGHTLVGTTDTPIATATLEPRPLPQEIDFILETASKYLRKAPSTRDVLSVFVGIRPLVKRGDGKLTAALSRDHTIHIDASGLLTTTGGKWTTYRNMAEHTVDQAADLGRLPERPCVTRTLNVHGFHPNAERFGTLRVYGSDALAIEGLMRTTPALAARLHEALPYTAAEVVWATRQEMARTVEDVLARRTRALFLNARAAEAMAPEVARLMGTELGWDAARQSAEVTAFAALAKGYQIDPA